jgi:hypothetical protein
VSDPSVVPDDGMTRWQDDSVLRRPTVLPSTNIPASARAADTAIPIQTPRTMPPSDGRRNHDLAAPGEASANASDAP